MDAALAPAGMCAVVVQERPFVAQACGGVVAGGRDQRFLVVQDEVELLTQKRGDGLFDDLRFVLRPSQSQEDVVGLSDGPQTSTVRVVGSA
jgi:hypothetical protein